MKSELARNILKGLLAVILVGGVLLLLQLFAPKTTSTPVELQTYREVEPFELTNQEGEALSLQDVKGKVWMANFIFTSCATECPTLSMKMAAVQERLADRADEVAFLSFSVDPQTDTPERLATYAKNFKAQPGWEFLTGDPKELDHLIKDSFLLPLAKDDSERSQIEGTNFIHSNRFAVVDQAGVVRYYHDGMEADVIESVVTAMEKLLEDQG